MEISPSCAVLAFALLSALAFLSKIFTSKCRHQLKFPPGPKPWPIIGNLNLIGPLPHQSLHKLSQQYGQTMQLKFGSFSVVVTSSPEMAKQFLKTHDHIFASRPQTAAGKYTAYNFSGITLSPYGSYWRLARKICFTELFSSKRLESYECIRAEEMGAFISRLYASSGKLVVLKDHIFRFSLSIASRLVLGENYFSEAFENSVLTLEEAREMLDEFFLLTGVFNIGDWIPWLAFLDLQGYVKRMKALKLKFDRFHNHHIVVHKAKMDGEKEFVPKDMMDLLLHLADDPSDTDGKLTYDGVKAITQEMIAGGTDTSSTTIEWAISELLKEPELINKANEELDRVIGRERWVEEKDIPQLPYIDAIMKETMRKHPVAPLLASHLALKDCNVGGYEISKGTRVFINTWSMG